MSFKTHSAPSFLEYSYYILIPQWFSSLIFRMHIGFFIIFAYMQFGLIRVSLNHRYFLSSAYLNEKEVRFY